MDIEQLRKICIALPHVTEDIKWGNDLCFCIEGKIFCIIGLDGPLKVSLKVRDEEFEELCATENIIPAPYLGRYKWILVTSSDRFNKKEWKHYIMQSYELKKAKLSRKKKK